MANRSFLRGGLRRHLLVVVAAVALPMLLWALGLTLWQAMDKRETIERDLSTSARAMALAVDQTLRLTMESLATAAASRALSTNDLEGFRQQAGRLLASHPDWHNLVVMDAGGRQILNTLLPAGAPLPDLDHPSLAPILPAFRDALAGRAGVSDLFHGPLTGAALVAVATPVRNGRGHVDRVLLAGVEPGALASLLAQHGHGPGWFAAVNDRAGRVVARAPGHDHSIGKKAPDWALRAIAERRPLASGSSMLGAPVHVAFTRSDISGWSVAFGAPHTAIYGDLTRALLLTLGFGLAVTAASAGLSRVLARRILHPVQALTEAARPFIDPAEPAGSPYGITELDELDRALTALARELRQSRRQFEKVFSVAPVMLFVVDHDGRLVEVNDTWLRVLGYRRDEVLGRRPWDFHTPQSRQFAQCVVRPSLLRQGQIDDAWAEYVTKSGEVREVLVSLRAEFDEDGNNSRAVGAMRDVTDQRRAERALDRAVAEAEKANAAKTRFLAAASHDLRQPLQALSLYLGILNQRPDNVAPILPAVNHCVDSLSQLLNDMLDMARLDAGIVKPKIQDVPLAQLMERVEASWRIQAEAKGLTLSHRACGAVVRTDPALMERILSNLVANAVRYTQRGRVLVGCRRAGEGFTRIEVRDTGIGIPADKLDDIFDEFHQLGNVERNREKGTGLGLSIVKRIATLLGHRIEVRSQPGRGSVFAVTLPSAGQCSLPDRAAPRDERDQRRRILVLDDEAHVRNSLALVLGEMGHEVATADDVEQALEASRTLHPELVIADFRLAGDSTGIEAVRAIRRQEGESLAAVVLTGDTDPRTIRHILASGLGLLHKPLQVDALKTFLRQVA